MFKNVLLISALLMPSTLVCAQAEDSMRTEQTHTDIRYLYSWTDDKGVIHITDGIEKVPKKFRDRAVRLEQREREEPADGPAVQPRNQPTSSIDEQELEEDRKSEWKMRLQTARKRLASAERRYQELDQRRSELLARASSASSPPGLKAEANKLEQEMQDVQHEIHDAQNEVDVVIPDEARKAGIPPGWLRD